jgi:hypothetical protein
MDLNFDVKDSSPSFSSMGSLLVTFVLMNHCRINFLIYIGVVYDSMYCGCTKALSLVLGLNGINFPCTWLCIPPKYLIMALGFLGEIPNWMSCF